MSRFNFATMDVENAKVLAEILAHPDTSEYRRVEILNKILEAREDQGFFQTILENLLTFGTCPHCGHENHWGIPEDDLNQMGWVSYEKDPRVAKNPTVDECPQFQEACHKKKITF